MHRRREAVVTGVDKVGQVLRSATSVWAYGLFLCQCRACVCVCGGGTMPAAQGAGEWAVAPVNYPAARLGLIMPPSSMAFL